MTWTRKLLRQRIGGPAYLGDTYLGTATGGSANNLSDTKLFAPDAKLDNAELVITSGSASGDYRHIAEWIEGTVIIPATVFSAAVASTDTYELHQLFRATDKNDAINQAILDAKWRWPRVIEDESITTVAATYTYTLANLTVPVDRFKGIDEVFWATGASDTGFPYIKMKKKDWTVRDANATLTLQLTRLPFRASQKFRLVYRVRPAVFTADTGAGGTLDPDVEPFAAYICARASASLCKQKAQQMREGRANEQWMAQFLLFQSWADGIMSADVPVKEPGRDALPTLEQAQSLDTDTRERLKGQGAELELEMEQAKEQPKQRRTKK